MRRRQVHVLEPMKRDAPRQAIGGTEIARDAEARDVCEKTVTWARPRSRTGEAQADRSIHHIATAPSAGLAATGQWPLPTRSGTAHHTIHRSPTSCPSAEELQRPPQTCRKRHTRRAQANPRPVWMDPALFAACRKCYRSIFSMARRVRS
ncbi:hypothetical protein GY45DRAFT_807605 [Cubamyces sp. BRFM 1775]|nr:hypothetical protein GY45DRAFT_807605 [Cubamyces sp. BRFM 1775]